MWDLDLESRRELGSPLVDTAPYYACAGTSFRSVSLKRSRGLENEALVSRVLQFERVASPLYGGSQRSSPRSPLPGQIRTVILRRSPYGGPLGFSIRGGREKGVHISRVAINSSADRACLLPGDRILRANGISFRNITHHDALHLLCTSKKLNLTVLSHSSSVSSVLSPLQSSYMWVDRNGRPVSPPHDGATVDEMTTPLKRTPSYRENIKESTPLKKVMLVVEKGLILGLMIRGGSEYGLGIFVTGVDGASAADLAGLQVGDQIISVNEHDFSSISHDEAVEVLQTCPRMTMLVRSVGKVPHSCMPYSGGGGATWYHDREKLQPPGLSRKGSSRKREINNDENPSCINPERAELRLDRKSKKFLTESQRISLAYYCNEYETGAMTVDAFVAVLLELLDTPEKYTLMTEIRGLVRNDDLDKFDELIYRREVQAMKSKKTMKLAVEIHAECPDGKGSSPKENTKGLSPRGSFRASTRRRGHDVHHLTVPDANREGEDLHTPSEDSGVDLANGTYYSLGSRKGSRVSTGSRESMMDSQLQRKSTWRSRISPRRSFDAAAALREANNATRMRRTMLRRHSSGGEGVNLDERRSGTRSFEDRRWSIGSEVPDTPAAEGHLFPSKLDG